MKKILYFVAVATLFTLSCQKEVDPEIQENPSASYTVKASIEGLNDPASKGTINASNQLVWAAGDQIGLFDGTSHSFTLSSGAGDVYGEFTLDEGTFTEANAASAFYPWSNNSATDGVVTFYLTSSNYGYSSGKMITPLVASLSGSTDKIHFKHAGAAVKVTINNLPPYASKIDMSVDGQQITGNFSINPANAGTDAMALSDTPDAKKNTTRINVWNGVESAWDFIFPVPELTKPKLSFSITDDNGINVWHKNLKAQASDLSRHELLVMPAIDIEPYSQFIVSADWTFCGEINGCTATDIPMYTDGTVCILKGVNFKAGDTIKVRKDKKDDEYYTTDPVASNATKDVWFTISSKTVELKDAKCAYPAPKVTLYFGINSSGGSGIALSSSGLGASGWPGVTLTQREYINNKWYYKYEVDRNTVWGNTISASIVGIGQWNTNATSLDFTTIKTEYYFEATKSADITQLGSRPSDPSHQTITIGTNLTDWSDVIGSTSGSSTIKVESDNDYVYIYCERVSASSEIWNGGGYLYLGFDLDTNASTGSYVVWSEHPYEFYALIYPYGGTSDSPAFYATSAAAVSAGKNAWSSAPSDHAGNITLFGVESSGTATFELRIPRNDIPSIPGSGKPITVELLGNKSFSQVSITHKLK